MVEELAHDYTNYLRQADISKEINPICSNIDDMLIRLEEFESLMATVKNDSNIIIQQNIPEIFACEDEFKKLCNKIDKLEQFISIVNKNLIKIDEHVSLAEDQLGVSSTMGIMNLFKRPIFGKAMKKAADVASIVSNGGSGGGIVIGSNSGGSNNNNTANNSTTNNLLYVPPQIFCTNDFFNGNNSVAEVNEQN